MVKQVIFLSKREITHGMKAGRKWTLWGYKVADGVEYTSFKNDYPLEEPMEIDYEESESKGRDGRVFINRRLIEPKEGMRMAKKELDTGEEILDKLKIIESRVDSILRGLKILTDKLL